MPNALHRLQLRLIFAVIFALLFAQLGATAHGYSHDAVAQSHNLHHSGPASHEACNDCIAYAGVLSSAGAPEYAFCIGPALSGLLLREHGDSLQAEFLALGFRSRAPPVPR